MQPGNPTPQLMRRYLMFLVVGWTLLLAVSCFWNIRAENEEMRLVAASRVQVGETRPQSEGRLTILTRLSEASIRHARLVIGAHLAIFFLGFTTMVWGGRHLLRQLAANEQAKKALQEREHLYRNLVETTAAVTWELDLATLRFTYVSPQVEKLSGLPAEQWTDFNFWAERLHPDDREYAVDFCKNETARGLDHAFEYRLLDAQGKVLWIRDIVNVIMEGDRPVILRGHFLDISEQKEMALALQEAHDELEARVEERTRELKQAHEMLLHAEKLAAIGRLSASIAHEFNNPLQGTMNILRGVARRATLSEDDAHLMSMAYNECIRMRNLIRSLRDFNRPTSGIVAPMDLHAALDSLLLLGNKEYASQQISIVKHYAANMPPIRAVADQIKQVLLNLLNNAVDACPGGGVITVATEVLPGRVVVRVHDTGTGIEPAVQERIFEPFFTTKPELKGTGLGLSVSYGIVKNHGGDIAVQSEPGKGTTFAVTLPIQGGYHEEQARPAGG